MRLLPHISVALSDGEGLSNWHQNVQCDDVYHPTKFEKMGL